ncbi:hypothetical protein [Aureimonas populi]|uniref:N-acetyltransferase domain-containing protein n=1 Tax=Aureimonas populi TaxID=1701758 RepID=A0ABW5CJR6_9HYPH|nr:hypothetical protein [Aureimonas populi]
MSQSSVNRKNSLRAVVATTPEHMRDVTILRSICFVHELDIPPAFIFDGNDSQATHFVFYDGDEPIGALRIRWFAGFAKYERTCFREKYRNPFIIKRCIQITFEHCARKGFTRIVTQSEPRLTRLWTKLLGLEVMEGKDTYLFGSEEPYHLLTGEIPAHPEPVSMDSPAEVLLRVEGAWDQADRFS